MKRWDKQQWLALLLLGLLLLVMASPTKKQAEKTQDTSGTAQSAEGGSYRNSYGDPYGESGTSSQVLTEKAALEAQLEDLLLRVEGIGEVRVMLMLKDTSDSITSFSTQDAPVSVQGVLIAAQGGDDPVVVRNIQEAVMALFQVEAHKIKVMKMK